MKTKPRLPPCVPDEVIQDGIEWKPTPATDQKIHRGRQFEYAHGDKRTADSRRFKGAVNMSETKKKSKREQPKHAQPTPGRTQKALKAGPHGKIIQTDGTPQSSPNPGVHMDGGSGTTKIKTKAR